MTEDTPVQRPRKLINEVVSLRRRVAHAESVAYVALACSGGLLAGLLLVIAWTLYRK